MKRITALLLLTGGLTFAQKSVDVPWNQVCATANGRSMRIQTSNGNVVEGSCFSVGVDEVAVRTKDQKVVRVARSVLSRITLAPDHQVKSLGRDIHHGLATGVHTLFSPLAPLGIVTIPATLAWGAVAAPFCLIGDLVARNKGETTVHVH